MNKKGRHRSKLFAFAGGGFFLGAAAGILLGMLLFDNPWTGPIAGAVLGSILGAANYIYQWGRKR